MTYDVLEDAKTVALEADFRARWWAERAQMWVRILDELRENEVPIYVYAKQPAPPPKVLSWWRRMGLWLLRGEA